MINITAENWEAQKHDFMMANGTLVELTGFIEGIIYKVRGLVNDGSVSQGEECWTPEGEWATGDKDYAKHTEYNLTPRVSNDGQGVVNED